MRELKIFAIVVVFTALVYYGVEPYAHSVMNPHIAPANFDLAAEDISFAKGTLEAKQNEFKIADEDLKKAKLGKERNADLIAQAESKQKVAAAAVETAKAQLEANQALWERVKGIDLKAGSEARGKEFFAEGGGGCVGCHGLKADGFESPIPDSSAYGVVPPDLSLVGAFYDERFLAALILNPAVALKIDHKYPDGFDKMTAYDEDDKGLANANIANLIAYFKGVAKAELKSIEIATKAELKDKYAKFSELDEKDKAEMMAKDLAFAKDRTAFIEACGRCHDMKYDNFKSNSAKEDLKGYLGSVPPDLSMYIRSRNVEYLNNFINNTQKALPNTAMPRVGLTEAAQKSVISYMEKVGDSKKDERTRVGIGVMVFFAILSVFAILWKRKVWSELH